MNATVSRSSLVTTPPVMDQPQSFSGTVPTVAFAVVGVCTLAIYVMVIRRGYLEKLPALPVFAVGANVAWEFTYAFVYPIYPQMRVTLFFWLPFNLIILAQVFAYGRRDFSWLSRRAYLWMLLAWLVFTFTFMAAATREFDDSLGVYTTVFVVVLMEALFLVMLRTRRSTAGQTMYIAVLKTVVDVSGGIALISWFPNRVLLQQMIVAEVVLDVIYVVMLRRQFMAEGTPAWAKV